MRTEGGVAKSVLLQPRLAIKCRHNQALDRGTGEGPGRGLWPAKIFHQPGLTAWALGCDICQMSQLIAKFVLPDTW